MSHAKTSSSTVENTESTTGSSRWLWMLTLCPCLAAVAASVVDSDLPILNVTRQQPALLFSTYLYHHGDQPIDLRPTLHSEFAYRNDGDSPVEITSIERSCGCMTPSFGPKIVAPGETGSIRVPIATINQDSGPNEYTLVVHYTDPKPRQTTLTIKATFPQQMVKISPSALHLSQKTSREFPLPDLTVSDFRPTPLKLTEVVCSAGFLTAGVANDSPAIQQVSLEEADGQTTKISGIVAGNIPPGRHHAIIAAMTDDEEFPVLSVPMIVTGPDYKPGVAPIVNPPQFRMVASEHPQAVRRRRVEVFVPEGWKVSAANAWPEQLSVEYSEPEATNNREQLVVLNVSLDELPPKNLKHGVIQLVANDGDDLVTALVNFSWP